MNCGTQTFVAYTDIILVERIDTLCILSLCQLIPNSRFYFGFLSTALRDLVLRLLPDPLVPGTLSGPFLHLVNAPVLQNAYY